VNHDNSSEYALPTVSEHPGETVPNRHGLGAFRRRARELAVAARTVAGGRRPWIEQALRDAVGRANRAANAAADRARPHIRGAARVAARRLDPTAVTDDRYAEALRALVEAISDEGGITYEPGSAGYVVEAGTGTGKMSTGIAYSGPLSQALEHARDLLHADARTEGADR